MRGGCSWSHRSSSFRGAEVGGWLGAMASSSPNSKSTVRGRFTSCPRTLPPGTCLLFPMGSQRCSSSCSSPSPSYCSFIPLLVFPPALHCFSLPLCDALMLLLRRQEMGSSHAICCDEEREKIFSSQRSSAPSARRPLPCKRFRRCCSRGKQRLPPASCLLDHQHIPSDPSSFPPLPPPNRGMADVVDCLGCCILQGNQRVLTV